MVSISTKPLIGYIYQTICGSQLPGDTLTGEKKGLPIVDVSRQTPPKLAQ